ncbi:hypothetical protein NDU88_000571 [Pleurodeles waltl]|uniref:Uncharacterized protein n=1 Tax=Pleurodeles waltl TaxID=8319 RepID=A0AAV7U435_PLEWA|nr:hypothetical protein NDU88_000571 [Pleurodeles waltl]
MRQQPGLRRMIDGAGVGFAIVADEEAKSALHDRRTFLATTEGCECAAQELALIFQNHDFCTSHTDIPRYWKPRA